MDMMWNRAAAASAYKGHCTVTIAMLFHSRELSSYILLSGHSLSSKPDVVHYVVLWFLGCRQKGNFFLKDRKKGVVCSVTTLSKRHYTFC